MPGKGSATPDKLAVWLDAYPDQPVVLAHWGGGLPFYELMPEIQALTRNVVYDCAATTYLYGFQIFEVALKIVGPERVLFGSDFPVLGQHRLLNRVRRHVPDAASSKALLGGNAEAFFQMNSGGPN